MMPTMAIGLCLLMEVRYLLNATMTMLVILLQERLITPVLDFTGLDSMMLIFDAFMTKTMAVAMLIFK